MHIPSLQLAILIVAIVTAATEWCTIWGDPHVQSYPTYEGQVPPQLMCRTTGTKTILKNKHVVITAEIGGYPYNVLSYILKFKTNGNVSCTFTSMPTPLPFFCGNDIAVTQVGGTTVYTYARANFVAAIRNAGDMTFWLPFADVTESSGMCISPGLGCRLEGTRRKRANQSFNSTQQAVSDHAAQICQTYVDAANKTLQLKNTVRPQAVANTISACIQDLQLTGDQSFAESIGPLLAFDVADQGVKDGNATAFTNSITSTILKAENSVFSAEYNVANRFPDTVNK